MQLPATVPEIAEAAELAALCGWENVRAEGSAALVKGLQEPLGAAAPPAQQALSDVYDFNYARDVVNNCAPDHAPLAPSPPTFAGCTPRPRPRRATRR
jgi:hypothetical protein